MIVTVIGEEERQMGERANTGFGFSVFIAQTHE